jgi:hypothetical protein
MGNTTHDTPAKQQPAIDKEAAGKSLPAPQFKLAAGNAVQMKGGEKAKEAKPETSKITASGAFTVSDKDGKEHQLTIKNNVVLEGSGKAAKEVGSIDGAGEYTLDLAGEKVTGNLKGLAFDKVSGVSISEKLGKKEIRSLAVNKEKATGGTIYFDDGAYDISKDGKLIRVADKKEAGSISVINGGEGGGSAISEVRYKYTDAKGDAHEGDLMDGDFASQGRKDGDMDMAAGEGSTMKFGKRQYGGKKIDNWMGFASKAQEWKQMVKHADGGWEMSGGGDLKKTLQRLVKEGKLSITDEQIDLMVGLSQVESSGYLNVINSWDSDKMSMGFVQFTAAKSLQEWILKVEPAFKAFGIELERDKDNKLVNKTIKKGVTAPWLKGMKSADDLRNSVWALRFFEAGLNDEIIAAEVTSVVADSEKILRHVNKTKAGAALFEKPVVKCILLEMENNRPAYLKSVTQDTQARLSATSTHEDLMKILKEEIMAIYKKNWEKHGNGKTEAAGEEKGKRLFEKVEAYF